MVRVRVSLNFFLECLVSTKNKIQAEHQVRNTCCCLCCCSFCFNCARTWHTAVWKCNKVFCQIIPSTGHRVAPPWFGVTCGSLRACLCASHVLLMCQWWLACACVRSAARWRMASRGDTGGPEGRLQTCSSAWTRSRRPRKAGRETPAWGKQQLKQQQCAE